MAIIGVVTIVWSDTDCGRSHANPKSPTRAEKCLSNSMLLLQQVNLLLTVS